MVHLLSLLPHCLKSHLDVSIYNLLVWFVAVDLEHWRALCKPGIEFEFLMPVVERPVEANEIARGISSCIRSSVWCVPGVTSSGEYCKRISSTSPSLGNGVRHLSESYLFTTSYLCDLFLEFSLKFTTGDRVKWTPDTQAQFFTLTNRTSGLRFSPVPGSCVMERCITL